MLKFQKILNNAKRIAVVRTDKIGDMVLTLPLIKAIKNNFNDSEIALISHSYTKDITENLDFIDIIYHKDKFDNKLNNIFLNYLPDVIFFPRPKFDEVRDAFLSRIKLRVGSAYRLYSILLNVRIKEHRKESKFNEAKYNLNLLSKIINQDFKVELPELYYDKNIKFDNLLEDKLISGQKPKGYFILHPGSGGSSIEWEPEKMGQIANKIAQDYNLLPIITGTNQEEEKCRIANEFSKDSLNICGKISLIMLKPLIKNAKFLIANSTGIIHIAASLKTPVIGFYPNTPHLSDIRWGPIIDTKLIIKPKNSNHIKYNDDLSSISFDDAYQIIRKSYFIDNLLK